MVSGWGWVLLGSCSYLAFVAGVMISGLLRDAARDRRREILLPARTPDSYRLVVLPREGVGGDGVTVWAPSDWLAR